MHRAITEKVSEHLEQNFSNPEVAFTWFLALPSHTMPHLFRPRGGFRWVFRNKKRNWGCYYLAYCKDGRFIIRFPNDDEIKYDLANPDFPDNLIDDACKAFNNGRRTPRWDNRSHS